ncbi:hypothetical protein KCP70_10270 [Salmonella enterica subsp. enterica]|nr:hypothetical protein KCP70_10270 [Salmonella enterica subsp. enterica]
MKAHWPHGDQTISTMTDEHQIDLQEKWKSGDEDAALYGAAHLTKPV